MGLVQKTLVHFNLCIFSLLDAVKLRAIVFDFLEEKLLILEMVRSTRGAGRCRKCCEIKQIPTFCDFFCFKLPRRFPRIFYFFLS